MENVAYEREQLIKHWHSRLKNTRALEEQLQKARKDLKEAELELANLILPEDARIHENIAIWFGDSLICAYRLTADGTDARVTVRTLGKSLT